MRTAQRGPLRAHRPPELISKEPLAPGCAMRRPGFRHRPLDDYALIEAEERGIVSPRPMPEEMLNSQNPAIRRLLGQAGDPWPQMGLDRRWAYNVIRAVGN